MPGLDRTGPIGQGSQTGRGLGKCNPNNQKTDSVNSSDDSLGVFGRCSGRRMGQGHGRGQGKKAGRGRGRGTGRGHF